MEIPEVKMDVEKHANNNIEIISVKELCQLLQTAKGHDPYLPHKINFYFILHITSKSYRHFIDFKSYEVEAGSTLFVTKNQIHQFDRLLSDVEGFAIVFDSIFIEKHYYLIDNIRLKRLFNYHIESPLISKSEIDENNLAILFSQLHYEFNAENSFAKTEILASLLHVLLLKAETIKEIQSISKVSAYWMDIFNDFRILLEKKYTETRSSRNYANQLNISYKLLNDVVKKLTGKTVKTFIDDFVIVEIKRYLISTSLTVIDISFKTGFEEPANMIKFFKKGTSTTPLQFRKDLLN